MLQNLCAPWIVDRNEPTPVALPPEDVRRFATHGDLLTDWIATPQSPPTDVQRKVAHLNDALRLGGEPRLQVDEALERRTEFHRPTCKLSRLSDQHCVGLVKRKAASRSPRFSASVSRFTVSIGFATNLSSAQSSNPLKTWAA